MVDPRGSLARFGYLTITAVVAGVLAAGLPVQALRRGLVVVLLAVVVAGWLAALSGRLRTWPFTVVVVATGLAGAGVEAMQPNGPAFVIGYMALAALALRVPRRAAVVAGAVVVAALAGAQVPASPRPVTAAVGVALGAGFMFAAGSLTAISREARETAEALLAQQEATRAAREQAAVLVERTRLARELHDVLAHTLSGLTVQLEGARLLAEATDADPRLLEQVTQAQALARDGMGNAQRAVSALRGDALPGPAQLPQLVNQIRAIRGIPVTLTVSGTARTLPAEAGLAVYRAVQEALTNTGKYAPPGATASVAVAWSDQDLQVDIVDTHPDAATSSASPRTDPRANPATSSGYGLAGLAERAALLGGSATAGPVDGGFSVRLRLPLPGPAAKENT
jgi:signal transduction histidine kinase